MTNNVLERKAFKKSGVVSEDQKIRFMKSGKPPSPLFVIFPKLISIMTFLTCQTLRLESHTQATHAGVGVEVLLASAIVAATNSSLVLSQACPAPGTMLAK